MIEMPGLERGYRYIKKSVVMLSWKTSPQKLAESHDTMGWFNRHQKAA